MRNGAPVAVEVSPVENSPVRELGVFSGSLQPRSRFVLSTRVAGRLVRVLPAYTVGTGNMFLVHPAAKVLPAKARAFRDFLLEHLDILTQRADLELSVPAPASPTGRGRRSRAR